MNRNIILILLLIVIIIGGIAYWIFSQDDQGSEVEITSFSAEGNITKDNPGQKSGVWYLIYEKVGSPAQSVELDLSNITTSALKNGDRVLIEGLLIDSYVEVTNLTFISPEENINQSIKLYYYNPKLDQGPGGVQCTKNGLVAVNRIIPKTETPLKKSIELLIRGELTTEEKAQGLESEFPLQGVTLKSASLTNGKAVLTFNDPQNKTGGGSCRVSILRVQVEATAKQFPTVTSVEIKPDSLFQP